MIWLLRAATCTVTLAQSRETHQRTVRNLHQPQSYRVPSTREDDPFRQGTSPAEGTPVCDKVRISSMSDCSHHIAYSDFDTDLQLWRPLVCG